MGAAYGALCRVYGYLGSVLVVQHFRSLIDGGAGGFRGARQTLGVLEGVQVSAAAVEQPCKISVAVHMGVSFLAIQHACRLVGIFIAELVGPLAKFLHVAGFQSDVHMVGVIVAIDGVFANQRLREIQCLDREVEQSMCIGSSHLHAELLLARRQSENGLAAAAARGSIAHAPSLEQRDSVASLC